MKLSNVDSLRGKVQTVLGLVEPIELGKTLVHEHLSMNFEVAYVQPDDQIDANNINLPFQLENLGWIRYKPYSHRPNLLLNDADCEEAIIAEMHNYKQLGGSSLVECTTHGIYRKASFLREISQKTGVNIIAGTGYYVAASHRDEALLSLPIEKLAEVIRSEIIDGCPEAADVRCGIIGEIGCSWPLHPFEKRVLQAAAVVQQELKCPVSIHPGRDTASPEQILRVFMEAGGDTGKVAMCHLDRTVFRDQDLFDFAAIGSFLEFDLFGNECSFYQLNRLVDMPSDAQRISHIYKLVAEGYENKLLISHDIHTKHRLTKYGGHGYSHILQNILPKMCDRGLAPEIVEKISTSNPAEWLSFH